MSTLNYIRARAGSRDGIALVMVLAFIVLLTILIISFIAFTRLNRSSTASYSKSIQAEEIAQGGMQDILSDVHEEIIAGSTVQTNGSSSYPPVYVPTTNYTAAPARFGYSAASFGTNSSTSTILSTLVRVSRADPDGSTALYPALNTATSYTNMSALPGGTILNRASAVNSSTNSSVNGRYISPARWNKTFLLASTTLATGASAIPSDFANSTPDWVYVTRTGSRVCQASEMSSLIPSTNLAAAYTVTPGQNPPASPVVGRYAYIMYDEGALLDANVVGFVSEATNTMATVGTPQTNNPSGLSQTVRNKSYSAYADMTLLPGFANNQSTIDNFVHWRNASYSPISNTTNYLNAVYSYAQNGFLNFQNGDSPLMSRQDLINYFANIDPPNALGTIGFNGSVLQKYSKSLPFLGTFSRAVSAPSWSPPVDASVLGGNNGTGNVYAYHTNAETATVNGNSNPNRDLSNVRFSKTGTVTHYYDDPASATPSATYTVNIGDPLVQTRFSLAKINWLSQANPNTGAAPPSTYVNPIQACFGLVWGPQGSANGGNACWTYVGSTTVPSTTAVGMIETLDQVAAENREPNFFELLKAAILSGSLALSPGQCGWLNGSTPPYQFRDAGIYAGGPEDLDIYSFDHTTTPAITAPSRIPDIQIMKIGANIIDQFDADSYPTAIYFPYSPVAGTKYDANTSGPAGIDHTQYGESDMVFGDENLPYLMGAYLIAGTKNKTDASGLNGWIQPQIWNPHQMPASFSTTTPQLTNYQIRGYGQAALYWTKEYAPPGSEAPTGTTATPSGELDGNYINFTATTIGNQQFYTTGVPTQTTTNGVTATASGANSGSMTAASTMMDYSMNPFIAFWLGSDSTYIVDPDYDGSGNAQKTKTNLITSAGFSLALGWTDSGGSFHPYSFMVDLAGFSYGVIGQEKTGESPANVGSAYPGHTGDDAHFYIDPRTGRFGTQFDWDSADWSSTFYPNPASRQVDTYQWGAPLSSNFTYATSSQYGQYIEDWEVNQTNPQSQTGAGVTYYNDPDGIVRPADGQYGSMTTGDGMALATTAGVPTGAPFAVGDSGGNIQHGRRPVVLNRPFRNVGELGYVFRDLPFKTLDFFTQYSADAGLLDVFSITDEARIENSYVSSTVAGEVDLNNAPLPIVEALLSVGSKKDLDPTYNIGTEVVPMATAIVGQLSPSGSGFGPLLNRSGLATQLGGAIRGSYISSADLGNKAYLEGPVRALSNVTNTRTWNLMIDIIAQSGHLTPTATTLGQFVVDGEKRYWLHIAIDRYTGRIVDQQLEPVYE